MIGIRDLRYRSLDIPGLTLDPGTTAVIGPNGSGKTTFLELCAGVAAPDSGTVTIDGERPCDTTIGWVCEFPDRNMIFSRVSDELASPLRFRHDDCREVVMQVEKMAENLGISSLLTRDIKGLSGGEKVLVSLATALVAAPHLLIMDETDSHLDQTTLERIREYLSRHMPPYILYCTQDMDAAASADHLLVFGGGRVADQGTPDAVFERLRDTCFHPPARRFF